jgi:hypothetical protein
LPPAQERFDGREVAEDLLTLRIGLPKVVCAAPGHTLEDHVGWSAQQHDGVEPGVELALVGDAARHEEDTVFVFVEELVDPVLAPERLGSPFDLYAVASGGELGEGRRLAGPGHPGHEHHGH